MDRIEEEEEVRWRKGKRTQEEAHSGDQRAVVVVVVVGIKRNEGKSPMARRLLQRLEFSRVRDTSGDERSKKSVREATQSHWSQRDPERKTIGRLSRTRELRAKTKRTLFAIPFFFYLMYPFLQSIQSIIIIIDNYN